MAAQKLKMPVKHDKKHGLQGLLGAAWQARRRPEAGNACKTRQNNMVSMRPGRPDGGQKQEIPVKREKEAWSGRGLAGQKAARSRKCL